MVKTKSQCYLPRVPSVSATRADCGHQPPASAFLKLTFIARGALAVLYKAFFDKTFGLKYFKINLLG
jgi:hypothetical protein